MSGRVLILIIALVTGLPAFGQGFAGLGSTPEGFALPDASARFSFPTDHGAHPGFRIEWWYVTANLTGEDGEEYGIQWTLFRNALHPSGRDEDQAWMGHAAVSTPEAHLVAERLARGGIGQADVGANPFRAFIDEWAMEGRTLDDIRLTAQGTDFAYELSLTTDRPMVPQGQQGYSVKSENGQASHYYSQPFYRVQGTLIFPDRRVQVSGQGWMDREWSSAPLSETQTGWDWISLHFETGDKLMGFRVRDTDGGAYTVGTWIAADGTPDPLAQGDLEMTALSTARVAGRRIPTAWRVTLPERGLDVRVTALREDSWMATSVPYWEGPAHVTGTHTGVGYLEMSGY